MSGEVLTKVCKECREEKRLDDFALNANGKLGRRSDCRSCFSAKAEAKRNEIASRVKVRVGCNMPAECRSKGINLCAKCANQELISRDGFTEWRASLRFPDEQSRIEHGGKVSARYDDAEFAKRASEQAKKMNIERYANPETSLRIRSAISKAKRLWHERRREDEEFEAFMARMEQEAAEESHEF